MVLIFTDNEILNKDLKKDIENSRVVYWKRKKLIS